MPFDAWGWYLLVSCVLIITGLIRGDWLKVFGVLLRQSCRISGRKIMYIAFMLATIVLTYGYEGVISSFITVPPPYFVLNTLAELLNNGYKIMVFNQVEASIGHTSYYHQLFARDGINASRVDESMAYISPEESTHSAVMKNMAHCNLTYCRYLHEPTIRNNPDIRCHFARETTIAQDKLFHYFGRGMLDFSQMLRRFLESGIWSMYETYSMHLYLVDAHNVQLLVRNEDQEPVVFNLRSPQVISIFAGWAVLLGISLSAILIEIFYKALIIRDH